MVSGIVDNPNHVPPIFRIADFANGKESVDGKKLAFHCRLRASPDGA